MSSGARFMQLSGVGWPHFRLNPTPPVTLYFVGNRRPRLIFRTPVPYLLGNGTLGNLDVTWIVWWQQNFLAKSLPIRLILLGPINGIRHREHLLNSCLGHSLLHTCLLVHVLSSCLVNPKSIGAATSLPVRKEVPHFILIGLPFNRSDYRGAFTISSLTAFIRRQGQCVRKFLTTYLASREAHGILLEINGKSSGIIIASLTRNVLVLALGPVRTICLTAALHTPVTEKKALFVPILRATHLCKKGSRWPYRVLPIVYPLSSFTIPLMVV